jgi:hypothetical protein
MIEELDVVDWDAYVEYQKGWEEYLSDYQARLGEIPIEEIEKFLKKKLNNIEI